MKVIMFFVGMLIFMGCKEERKVFPLVTELEGTTIPEFSILTAEGEYLSSNAFPDGHPVVIFYFNPGCIQCRVQVRNIIDYMDKLKDVQICLVTAETSKEVYQFTKHFKLGKYPNVVVGTDTGYVLSRYYQASSVPYTAIYDKDKRFKSAYMGRMEGKQITTVAHLTARKVSGK